MTEDNRPDRLRHIATIIERPHAAAADELRAIAQTLDPHHHQAPS